MALLGVLQLFLLATALLSLSTSSQGVQVHHQHPFMHNWKHRYPFIKEASTITVPPKAPQPIPTTPPSSSSWKNTDKEYDYIIIGGGTAGCPLAATLSRNFSVLLLERGGVPFNNPNVSHMENFHLSLADLSPKSASQAFLSTDGVINARARVLGGGSAINAGFYTRANPSFVKRAGWDDALVNQSYPWIEKQIVQQPKLSPWQDAVKNGLLEVGVHPYNGFSYDHKYGTKVGGTLFGRRGERHTAAELLASANPENLQVYIYATVQKIVFDTKSGNVPKAVGVLFKDERGRTHEAFLSKNGLSEVILSSGAIGSPQLLLLSGIGPKADLEKLNISVVLDNENVGKVMSDNPMNSIFIPTKEPIEQSLIETVGITKMGVFIEASSGFGQSSDSFICNHGIMSAEIGQLSTIPPKQRSHEAVQAYKERKRDIPYELFKGGFLLEKIVGPLSTGELRLLNTNPDDNPAVTFNYFSHPTDLRRCVYGIRLIEKLIRSKPFAQLTNDDKFTMDKILNMSVAANVNLIPKHTNNTKSLKIGNRNSQNMESETTTSESSEKEEFSASEIEYVSYGGEHHLPLIMRLVDEELSEPYSIFTYRYFVYLWPNLSFLAFHKGNCVGTVVCKMGEHRNTYRGYIAMLVVIKPYRGKGIATELVTKSIQVMMDSGCEEVTLEAEVTNKGALALYGRLGFIRAKRLFRYYLNGVDAFRLKLLFPRTAINPSLLMMASSGDNHLHSGHEESSQFY